VYVYGDSRIYAYNLTTYTAYLFDNSEIYAYDSKSYELHSYDNSEIWAINSTVTAYPTIHDQSKIYVCWYLDVHVTDSIDQDVPSANVTAIYPNASTAESKPTDSDGWARLTLMEKMMNATGQYPVGNYTVEATYGVYSNTTTVNMTENKQFTLRLEDFVIPEFHTLIILSLFITVMLLAAIIYRRRHTM